MKFTDEVTPKINDRIPAVGYCRFSSDHQKELSIEAQQRAITEFCNRNGYVIQEWFIDRAYSGQTIHRPDFQRLLRIVESGKCGFAAVIVHKLDRFSRNVVDSFQYQQFFSDHSIELISTEENFSGDEFIFGLNALLNQRYVRSLAKEVKKGLNERAYKALFNGGTPPLGFKIENGKYIIVESEAIIVRTIFELAAQGYGYNSIIQELNSKGYKTKNNNPFGKNSLYDLLHNEKYKGVYVFNKAVERNSKRKRNMHKHKQDSEIIRIEDAIPSIVSKELWERANASRKLSSKLSTNAKYNYMLSGLLYCGECGAKMHGNHRHSGSGCYNTYRCNKQANQLTCNCSEIRADRLERFVIDNLIQHFFNTEVIDIMVEQVNTKIYAITQSDKQEVRNSKNALQGLQLARSNLVEAIAQTGFNQTIADRLDSIEKQISEHQRIINEDEIKRTEIKVTREDVERKIKTLKTELMNRKNIEQVKILLHYYIDKIVIDNNSVKVTFKVAFSFCLNGDEVEVCYNYTITEARKHFQKTA